MDYHMDGTQKKMPSWLGWVGHMPRPANYLLQKQWASLWGPIKIIDTIFRSIGVVAFACNPLTGILIFCGMLSGNIHVALGGLMGGVIGILTSLLLRVDNNDICSGLSSFNSILTGAVSTIAVPAVLGIPLDQTYWILLAVACVVTVFVDQGLNTMMSPSGLPGQSVPFNIVTAVFFVALKMRRDTNALTNGDATAVTMLTTEIEMDNITMDIFNGSTTTPESLTPFEELDWCKYFYGTIIAAGQIYGVDTIASSLFVWFGFLIYSPTLAIMMYAGSHIGCLTGVFFASAYNEVYNGLWGYNSLLACGGYVYFCTPPPFTLLGAIVNAVCAALFQVALTPIFAQNSVPVFSFPFNIAVNLLLAVAMGNSKILTFVTDRTFPELDAYRYFKTKRHQNTEIADYDDESVQPLRKLHV